MSQGDCYPARETGVVAVPGESGLRLRRRDKPRELILNPTAVLIWHACDGQRTIDEIAAALRVEWPDYRWPDAEVENSIERLADDGILARSNRARDTAVILRAGFLGPPPGFDPADNYFIWMLSRRAAVIATDPTAADVDVLLYTGINENNLKAPDDRDCIRIRIALDPDEAGGDTEADFVFDLSGRQLGQLDIGYGLPPWIDALDWWGNNPDDDKPSLERLTRRRVRDRAPPSSTNWTALEPDAAGQTDATALFSALSSRHGKPRPLLERADGDEESARRVDRRTAADSAFTLITGSAESPDSAGGALLGALAAGAVPLYAGDARLVAGINERAYVDTGIYASTGQIMVVADMLGRDTAYRERLLAPPVFYGNRLPAPLEPGEVCDALWQALFDEPPAARKAAPPPAAPSPRRKLTIGMATYDDYDGVYFSIQAVRLYHPEALDEIEFLIVDNNPDGPCGEALRKLARSIPDTFYTAHDRENSTAVRNQIFLDSDSEYVLCMDSHVLIVPGALRKLLDYYDAHPECRDLLQGPLLWDDMRSVATHFKPAWSGGMWGSWDSDERGREPEAEPFDIPMQGLGLFSCRRAAWPGFHPDFRGFGGEEGYIHEKVRQAGGRTLCLPFLRWMHRFGRPLGPPYKPVWEDRIRNYFLGFRELGLDTAEMEAHFTDHVNSKVVERTRQAVGRELESPFARFDAVYAIDLNADREQWNRHIARLEDLGLAKRARYQPAPPDAGDAGSGFAIALREILSDAQLQGFETVAVLDSDAIFRSDAAARLAPVVDNLDDAWEVIDLGAAWPGPETAGANAIPAALALHARAFDRLMAKLPTERDPAGPRPALRLSESLAGLRQAVTKPAGIAADPRLLPLDQYLV